MEPLMSATGVWDTLQCLSKKGVISLHIEQQQLADVTPNLFLLGPAHGISATSTKSSTIPLCSTI